MRWRNAASKEEWFYWAHQVCGGFTLRSVNSLIGLSRLIFAAEEGGNGKIILIKRGAYKEMDACLMCIRNLFLEEWMHGADDSCDHNF
jgi:hypothetical protein